MGLNIVVLVGMLLLLVCACMCLFIDGLFLSVFVCSIVCFGVFYPC